MSTVPDSTKGEINEKSFSCIQSQYIWVIILSLSGFCLNRTVLTDIGTLLTVIISKPPNPDIGGNIVKLSFLLPIINLAIGKKETSLLTEAILTTQKTSGFIRTPLFGQLQSYQTLVLRGTARYH
ncbi:hypothetical protein [Nostoc sp.]